MGLSLTTEYRLFSTVLILVSFSHYLMFFYYSRKKLYEYFFKEFSFKPLSVLFILFVSFFAAYYDQPHIVFFFWLHHVWNETYLNLSVNEKLPNHYLSSKFLFESLLYLAIVNGFVKDYFHVDISSMTYLGLIFTSVTIMFVSSYLVFERKRFLNDVAFSLFGILFALFSIFGSGGTIDHILLYHFLYWMIYPLTFKHMDKNLSYILLTLLSVLIFVPFTPVFPVDLVTENEANRLIRIFGYIHILFSLGVSYYHPEFIRNIFMKEQSRRAL